MWQPVLTISGYILGILGLVMLIPAGLDISQTGVEWSPFLTSAICSMFLGFSLFLSNYTKFERINLKQAYLVTVVSWLLVGVLSAMPFYLSGVVQNKTDAFFEAFSGLTGTGATIISDVEALPSAILLWRSLLNGLGGLGIVIFAVALLPFLGIGGMQIFQRENSDSNDKFMPRFSYIAKRIVMVYLLLIAVCGGAYVLCGMGFFDAFNHAVSVIGTGGFSTKNASIGAFDSRLIDFVTMIFMLTGALPMTFYILLSRGLPADRNRQVRTFLKFALYVGLVLGAFLYVRSDYSLFYAMWNGMFTTIALVTTTGLATVDYTQWGVWMTAVVLLLSLSGGCTGSTCGSIKILRWQVVYAFLRKYLLSVVETNRVVSMKIGAVNVSEKVSMSVFVYLLSFMISLLLLTLLVSATGIDFQTSISAVLACITNVGVGAIDVIGPHGNYAFFAPQVKWILMFTMFLGRLEVITVLVLFSASFWRR